MSIVSRSTMCWGDGLSMSRGIFMERFGRTLNASGGLFMDETDRHEIHAELDRLAEMAHLPTRDGTNHRWPMSCVLPGGLRRLLAKHLARFHERGFDADSDYFTMVDQTPQYTGVSQVIPTLLRKSCVWSFKRRRAMLASEHLRLMGISLPQGVDLPAAVLKAVAGNAMQYSALSAVVLHVLSSTVMAPARAKPGAATDDVA